jgi:hypothetical protein
MNDALHNDVLWAEERLGHGQMLPLLSGCRHTSSIYWKIR